MVFILLCVSPFLLSHKTVTRLMSKAKQYTMYFEIETKRTHTFIYIES